MFSRQLLGQSPVGIVTLKDAMAVVVEAERDAMGSDHGVQGAEITESILGFELEVRSQDLAGGIVLKANESELGAAALQPVMAAGIGERHHTHAGARQTTGAILARPAFLGRSQFCAPQETAHGLPADLEILLSMKLFAKMGIVEALILAASQVQNQLLLGKRQSPRHLPPAIAVLYPGNRIGLIAAFEPLHLPFTELQQERGFAYAQSSACRILYHFHSLELFLTHRHHPYRVTKSRCSYGVTLSWSIYRLFGQNCTALRPMLTSP